jgi:predicted metalloendopeptidase
MRERLLTDPHSPPEYRVNGIVRNVDAWYKAFNVKPGDKLYLPPEERVSIW